MDQLMTPADKKSRRLLFEGGILIFFILLSVRLSLAEIYSVQAGNYQKLKNAEKQVNALRRKIDPTHLEAWRIDKNGPRYAVRIGKFNQEKPARQLLSRIKKAFPQASLWKGDYKKSQIVRVYGPTSLREKKEPEFTSNPSRSVISSRPGEPGQETLSTIPEKPLEIRRAILWGTVLESSPLTGNPLGLVPEKEISRMMVRVDKSEAVKGYPNFLQDKETEEIILFLETRQPFFLPAQKIRALVEYQGDKYKRFFWIKQVETVKP